MSLPLVFEMNFYLTRFKVFRLFTLYSAVLYNIAYVIAEIEAYLFLFEAEDDKVEYDVFSIIEFCILIFNLATNISPFVINWFIIYKEFSLEFFQLL